MDASVLSSYLCSVLTLCSLGTSLSISTGNISLKQNREYVTINKDNYVFSNSIKTKTKKNNNNTTITITTTSTTPTTLIPNTNEAVGSNPNRDFG
jgi:hypothetical protein